MGTDISIQVCKEEGYLMMDKPRRKYNHNVDVRFIEQNNYYGYRREDTWNTIDLWDSYERSKSGIQSCCDYHVESIDEIKSYWDMLVLADAINGYKGIFESGIVKRVTDEGHVIGRIL